MNWLKNITEHYYNKWIVENEYFITLEKGPMITVNPKFTVMVIPPNKKRGMWTYATVGMSVNAKSPIELHLFSPIENNEIAEILTAIAYYNVISKPLGLDDTVNFGKPWLPNSTCDHGLISRPYLDGKELEEVELYGKLISFFWLIPITLEERNYRWNFGMDNLEELFEIKQLNYLNPLRSSVT